MLVLNYLFVTKSMSSANRLRPCLFFIHTIGISVYEYQIQGYPYLYSINFSFLSKVIARLINPYTV